MLKQFMRTAGSSARKLSFAQEWGVLDVGQELSGRDKIEGWESLAKWLSAVVAMSSALNENTKVDFRTRNNVFRFLPDWVLGDLDLLGFERETAANYAASIGSALAAMPEGQQFRRQFPDDLPSRSHHDRRTSREYLWLTLETACNWFLWVSRARPITRYDPTKEALVVHFVAASVAGALALGLTEAVLERPSVTQCEGCGQMVDARKSARRRWCDDCRPRGAQAAASRDYRRRRREGLKRLALGESVEQVAASTGARLSTVTEWATNG